MGKEVGHRKMDHKKRDAVKTAAESGLALEKKYRSINEEDEEDEDGKSFMEDRKLEEDIFSNSNFNDSKGLIQDKSADEPKWGRAATVAQVEEGKEDSKDSPVTNVPIEDQNLAQHFNKDIAGKNTS